MNFSRPLLGLILAFLLLSPTHAEWRAGTPLPTAIPQAVAAAMDGKLFVMGSRVGQGFRSLFEQYDIAGDGWRPLTPMPVALSQFAMAAGTGRVFVSGGRENQSTKLTSALWMFAPDTAVWLELGSLPSPRADHTSVFFGNQLFMIGGIGPDAAAVQSYNLTTGKWSSWKNPMPVAVSNAAATQRDNEIIIAGGSDSSGRPSKAVQAFHLIDGTWRRLPDLPLAITGGALGVIDGALHFAGGFSPTKGKVLNSHNWLVDRRWQRLQPMPGSGRHRMAYYGSGDRFLLIGGAVGGGFYALFTASDLVSIFTP